MSKYTALFIDGPVAGRQMEVPSPRHDITVAMAAHAARAVQAYGSVYEDPPVSDAISTEKTTYYVARTYELPFGFVFYSLHPMDPDAWTRGVKMMELAIMQGREALERAWNTRITLAEKQVADLSREVAGFRYTMSRLGDAITAALPRSEDR